jgi:hemerythrin
MTAPTDAQARTPLEWRESFRMNIATIDVEHRLLFTLVKQLHASSVRETLDELLEYVHTHFHHEQQLMDASGYPDADEHRLQHRHLAERVAQHHASPDHWPSSRVEALRGFLNGWLESHILIHDLAFGRWYAESERRRQAATAQRGWLDSTLGRI